MTFKIICGKNDLIGFLSIYFLLYETEKSIVILYIDLDVHDTMVISLGLSIYWIYDKKKLNQHIYIHV